MKKTIKLTENELKRMVMEAVNRVLNEGVEGDLIDRLIANGPAVYEEGTPEYAELSNMSNYDFSVISCDMEDSGYHLYWDVVGDRYEVTR